VQSRINQTEVRMVRPEIAHAAPSQPEKSPNARWRTLRQTLRAAIYRRLPSVFHLGVLAHTIAHECRSSLGRIRGLTKQVGVYPILECGNPAGRDSAGHLILCSRTQACTQDIGTLIQRYPWLTVQEQRIAVEAWRAGAEWGRSDAHKCSACSELTIQCKTGRSSP
jgi:hypothetical protein